MAELHQINEPPRPPGAPSFSALFSLGFRPLYIGGMAWGLVAIFIWVFVPDLISPQLGPLAWHAHEMLWGFIATIAVGFLLTAAATWTGTNPVQGRALAALCGLWLVARLAYLAPGTAMLILAVLAESLFLLLAALALWRVIQQANSHRNYGLPWLLLGLAIANLMFVNTAHEGNYNALMTTFQIGLIDMAVIALLVARRVIPFFAMRAIQGLTLPMHTGSGQAQLALGLLAIMTGLLGLPTLSGGALVLTGLIGLYQLLGWKPLAVRHRPIVWILYAGYALLASGLITAGAWQLDLLPAPWARAAVPVHVIGMGGFSVLIIGMVTRTALGHLGRPLQLDRSMLISYILVLAAILFRLSALWPSAAYATLLYLSGVCWVGAMALYLWRFAPWLIRPRSS